MDKALLFDLDGTLFDTSYVNYFSYKRALNEVNCDFTFEYYMEKCYGKNYKEFLLALVPNKKVEIIHRKKMEYYSDFLYRARKNRLLLELILQVKGIFSIGLVTTASLKNTNEILRYFQCSNLFDIIVTKEDVVHTKPHPEGYLKAMNSLKVEPQNVIIFEDSEIGLKAAADSGANIVKIERF